MQIPAGHLSRAPGALWPLSIVAVAVRALRRRCAVISLVRTTLELWSAREQNVIEDRGEFPDGFDDVG